MNVLCTECLPRASFPLYVLQKCKKIDDDISSINRLKSMVTPLCLQATASALSAMLLRPQGK